MKVETNKFDHSVLGNQVLGEVNVTMDNAQGQQSAETNDWEGVDNTVSDPEEARVIYSALDSFA